MLNWLAKVFQRASNEELCELKSYLFDQSCWSVPAGTRNLSAFLHSLADLVPEGSILFVEASSPSREVKAFLKLKSIPPRARLQSGTTWPRAAIYHLPVDKDVLSEYASLAEHCAEPEVCDHLQVYKDDTVLVQAFDADVGDDPVYISKQIPRERVAAFCQQLGCTFEDIGEPGRAGA